MGKLVRKRGNVAQAALAGLTVSNERHLRGSFGMGSGNVSERREDPERKAKKRAERDARLARRKVQPTAVARPALPPHKFKDVMILGRPGREHQKDCVRCAVEKEESCLRKATV